MTIAAAITDHSAATALVEHFAAADDVLKNGMDIAVLILSAGAPDSASDYANARIIVDSGGGDGG